ncbi:MAG TPA: hypothetical protein P5330_01140 [Candidatus Competibacteraceae bacterium]|nr:hypothetical protein [Candidatus Competibacteraceae bacterium]
MKAFFLKSTVLVFLASAALSVGAKPAEVQLMQSAQWDNPLKGNLQIAAGTATTAIFGQVDRPISSAKPRRR